MTESAHRFFAENPDGDQITVAGAEAHHAAGQEIVLLVGPEGGFTDSERTAILSAGFLPVRIGSTVLRIETAAIALLAATVAMCQ